MMQNTSIETPVQQENLEPHLLSEKINDVTRKVMRVPIRLMAIIGSCAVVAMALITVGDVTGRYVAKRPIEGSDELVGLVLVCLCVCGFAYCQMGNGHIRVDLLTSHLPRRARPGFDAFAHFVALSITSLICWQMFAASLRFMLNLQGGNTVSETLGIPWFPFLLSLGIGFGIFALVLLVNTVTSILKVANR